MLYVNARIISDSIIFPAIIYCKIEEAKDVEELRSVCFESVDITMEAGFSLPITSLAMEDKRILIQTIKLHFVLVRNKGVIDQLMSGLASLGVLEAIQQNPTTFQPLFLADKQQTLTAGRLEWSYHDCYYKYTESHRCEYVPCIQCVLSVVGYLT